jgi:hypothetical protein
MKKGNIEIKKEFSNTKSLLLYILKNYDITITKKFFEDIKILGKLKKIPKTELYKIQNIGKGSETMTISETKEILKKFLKNFSDSEKRYIKRLLVFYNYQMENIGIKRNIISIPLWLKEIDRSYKRVMDDKKLVTTQKILKRLRDNSNYPIYLFWLGLSKEKYLSIRNKYKEDILKDDYIDIDGYKEQKINIYNNDYGYFSNLQKLMK